MRAARIWPFGLALLLALRLVAPAAAHDAGVARATLAELPGGRYVLEAATDAARRT